MNKQKYLLSGVDFNTEVLTLAAFADTMINTSVVTKGEGENEDQEDFPYKESGEKIMKGCRELFKKGQAHMKAMFRSDNKTNYTELNFNDHFALHKSRVRISKNHEENLSEMNSLCLKIKQSTRNITPAIVHFDSGAKWSPTTHDNKRHESMLEIVDDIEKLLS